MCSHMHGECALLAKWSLTHFAYVGPFAGVPQSMCFQYLFRSKRNKKQTRYYFHSIDTIAKCRRTHFIVGKCHRTQVAFVWPGTAVRAEMNGQMALRSIAFVAQLTTKRLLSRVNALMFIQFGRRGKHFATFGANEFLHAFVPHTMISQCYLSFEFFAAFGALERCFRGMCDQMALKTMGTHKRFTAEIAHISSNIFVHFSVQGQ